MSERQLTDGEILAIEQLLERKPKQLSGGQRQRVAVGRAMPVPLNGFVATLMGNAVKDVRVGDPVELWGPSLPVNEIAACAGTIGYELLAGMTARLPRVYIDSG